MRDRGDAFLMTRARLFGAKICPPTEQEALTIWGSIEAHVFYYEAGAGGVEEEHFRPIAGLRDL